MARITRRSFTLAAGTLGGALALNRAAAHSRPTPPGRNLPDASRTELRGVWVASVANTNWPSRPGLSAKEAQRELIATLDDALGWNLNTVYLQVRPTADAFWPSPHEPWSAWLTGEQGRDPGWDPLGFAVRAAHDRGLALHAWCNPYRVATHADRGRLAPSHPVRRHPEWAVEYAGRLYYNPGIPEVRHFVQDAMMHAVDGYPIDGLHWDDYFYPYPAAGHRFDDDDAFARYGADFADRAQWRRSNVDLLVREMYQRVRAARPACSFGISPFAVWRNSTTDRRGSQTSALQTYDALYADTRRWVKEGWLDYIVPQVYWNIGFAAADYATVVPWWSDVVDGTGVRLYIGEAVYKVGDPAQPAAWQDPAELSRHIELSRDHSNVGGNVYFSASQVAADPLGAMSRVHADHYRWPAPAPRC